MMSTSVEELELGVSHLSTEELASFSQWFDAFMADQWDRRIEADVAAGRLDALAVEALRDGRCTDL